MVGYVFNLIERAKDNRQKQLGVLQAEIWSDRYRLKPFNLIVKYCIGNLHQANTVLKCYV